MDPSPWIVQWSEQFPSGGAVLDLACGSGRNSRWFLDRGHPVTAVDRDTKDVAAIEHDGLEVIRADLECEPWPLSGRVFCGVVVINYLWRPLMPDLLEAVAVDGVLLYETFAVGNERFGKPRNPDHLLREGELLTVVAPAFRVLAYEHLVEESGQGSAVRQRICAIKTSAGG